MEKRSGAVNENLATGEIEIIPEELRVLSESETPPFQIEENSKTKEEIRLKYQLSGSEKTGSAEEPDDAKQSCDIDPSVSRRRRISGD